MNEKLLVELFSSRPPNGGRWVKKLKKFNSIEVQGKSLRWMKNFWCSYFCPGHPMEVDGSKMRNLGLTLFFFQCHFLSLLEKCLWGISANCFVLFATYFFTNFTWDIIRFFRVALILDDVFSVKVTGIGSLLFAETTSFLHADACC